MIFTIFSLTSQKAPKSAREKIPPRALNYWINERGKRKRWGYFFNFSALVLTVFEAADSEFMGYCGAESFRNDAYFHEKACFRKRPIKPRVHIQFR